MEESESNAGKAAILENIESLANVNFWLCIVIIFLIIILFIVIIIWVISPLTVIAETLLKLEPRITQALNSLNALQTFLERIEDYFPFVTSGIPASGNAFLQSSLQAQAQSQAQAQAQSQAPLQASLQAQAQAQAPLQAQAQAPLQAQAQAPLQAQAQVPQNPVVTPLQIFQQKPNQVPPSSIPKAGAPNLGAKPTHPVKRPTGLKIKKYY